MKKTPFYQVLFGMFPNAMRALAEHAQYGSEKHNPGEELHWAFDKSTDHAGSCLRHLAAAGTIDPETGKSHSIGALCRAAMLLETELIQAGADPGFAVEFDTLKKIPAPAERWIVEYNYSASKSPEWHPSVDLPEEFPNESAAVAAIQFRKSGADCHRYRAVRVP